MVVSENLKNAYKEGSHKKNLIVYFPSLDYTVPSDEVYYESFSLDEAIFDGDSFEAVGCISSSMEVSIRDFGEELKDLQVHVSIEVEDFENEPIDLFDGIIDEVSLEYNKRIRKIKAYDKLYTLSNKDVSEWYKNLSFPISLEDLRSSLFVEIDIPCATTNLPNDDVIINKQYEPNTLNALTVVKSICQINGVFGIINRLGIFEYRTLSNDTETVPFYKSFEYQGYTTLAINRVTIRQNSDDSGVHYGTGDNNYIVQGNMFSYGLEAEVLRSMAENIYSNLSGISYIPFEASNYGYPWMECGLNPGLDYSVYDFVRSQDEDEDIYEDVHVIFFSRSLTGIQNLTDTFNARGQKEQSQKIFVSDIGSQIETIQQTIEELQRNTSTEISTYRNTRDITINDGQYAVVGDITYDANNGDIAIYHEEISASVEATGTEYDPVLEFQYYVNGKKLLNHISKGRYFEGLNIISLMQFWKNGTAGTYRIQTRAYPINCNITIPLSQASAYVIVRQGEVDDFQLEIAHEPNKTDYYTGESLDYTGLVIVKAYYDGVTPDEDVTTLCTIEPVNGSTFVEPQTITCKVTYRETNEVGEESIYTASFYCYYENKDFEISIVDEPTKLDYITGESLDYTGLRVVKQYFDSQFPDEDITNLVTIEPAEGYVSTSPGSITCTVTYSENDPAGVEHIYTDYFYVDYEYEDFELDIAQPPNKTHYTNASQILNYDGLIVVKRVTYKDGTIIEYDVTDLCTYNPPENTMYGAGAPMSVIVTYSQQSPAENPAGATTSFDLYFDPNFPEEEEFVDSTDDLDPSDPMYNTDPIGDGSYDYINIPYVIYDVDYDNHTIMLNKLDTSAIRSDNPDYIYIPSVVTSTKGTKFITIISDKSGVM